MKDNTERTFYEVIKIVSHTALLAISTLLTINLFVSFSENSFYKILWTILGVTLEMVKIYIFVLAKAHLKFRIFTSYVKSFFLILIYLGLAFISFSASAGFTLMSIGQQASTSVALNESSDVSLIDRQVTQLDKDIARLEKDIDIDTDQKAKLPENYITARKNLDTKIATNTDMLETKTSEVTILLLEKSAILNIKTSTTTANSSEIFTLLGEAVNLSGENTMLYLMLLLAFLLEIITATTSGNYHLNSEENKETPIYNNTNTEAKDSTPTIEQSANIAHTPIEEIIPQPKVKETLNKEAFVSYIKALFSEGKDKLVNDITISEMTGMKLNHCKNYRRRLQGMEYNGSSLIAGKKGVGTQGLLPLKAILKLIDSEIERQWK